MAIFKVDFSHENACSWWWGAEEPENWVTRSSVSVDRITHLRYIQPDSTRSWTLPSTSNRQFIRRKDLFSSRPEKVYVIRTRRIHRTRARNSFCIKQVGGPIMRGNFTAPQSFHNLFIVPWGARPQLRKKRTIRIMFHASKVDSCCAEWLIIFKNNPPGRSRSATEAIFTSLLPISNESNCWSAYFYALFQMAN